MTRNWLGHKRTRNVGERIDYAGGNHEKKKKKGEILLIETCLSGPTQQVWGAACRESVITTKKLVGLERGKSSELDEWIPVLD